LCLFCNNQVVLVEELNVVIFQGVSFICFSVWNVIKSKWLLRVYIPLHYVGYGEHMQTGGDLYIYSKTGKIIICIM
jgi:hypothetical protein